MGIFRLFLDKLCQPYKENKNISKIKHTNTVDGHLQDNDGEQLEQGDGDGGVVRSTEQIRPHHGTGHSCLKCGLRLSEDSQDI